MLSRKDLVLTKHTDKTKRLLASQSVLQLLYLVKRWFNVPELRPTHKTAQLAIYKELRHKKSNIIERILKKDWPRGFYAIQIAQLEINELIVKESVRSWQVGRILTAKGRLRLDLDATAIKESMEDFLSKYLNCYLYVLHHKDSDLYWMRIEIFPKFENCTLSEHQVIFLIFYPQTEFVITNGKLSTIRTYIKEAILHTYRGDKIDFQRHRGEIITQITSVIRNRASQGAFAELRYNLDSNPLDIRQKAQVRLEHEQEEPARTSDLDRRMKPLDQEEVNMRKRLVLENFGHGYVSSTTSLRVNADLPFNANPSSGNDKEVPTIKFELNLTGTNIAQGVKNLIQMGRVDVNMPKWLSTIGMTGATQLYLTKNGASQVEPEEDEESDDKSQMEDVQNGEQDQEEQYQEEQGQEERDQEDDEDQDQTDDEENGEMIAMDEDEHGSNQLYNEIEELE